MPSIFHNGSVTLLIEGLLRSDPLTEEKGNVLQDWPAKESFLAEVANILNKRMAAMHKWSWSSKGFVLSSGDY
jgi:hypothetical protein